MEEIRLELVATQREIGTTVDENIGEIRELANNAIRQLNKLPADIGTGGGGIRPKLSQPPPFSGEKGSIKLKDWRNLVELWNKSQGVHTDTQRIVNALSLLRSPAADSLEHYFDRNAKDQDLGTIAKFWETLEGTYGQLDRSATASRDLEKLLDNKNLAQKDLIKFSVQFKVLLDSSDKPFTDKYMIGKIHDLLEPQFKMFILGKGKTNWPTRAPDFMQYILQAYKEVYPEKAQDHIFEKGNSGGSGSAKDPNAMDVDAANAKRNKGKGKQANSQEAKPAVSEPCAICTKQGKTGRAKTHNTLDCFELKSNSGKASTSSSGNNNGNGAAKSSTGGKASGKGKDSKTKASLKNTVQQLKNRLLEAEKAVAEHDSDAEDDNKVNINSARITEWDEENDPNLQETPAEKPADEPETTYDRLRKRYGKGSARKVDFVSDL